ncbi:MAG TPA: zinc ribbon domain-containing protein, partial [Chloroflexi bacterium]|nr:zinc ribbon domain-containing protein [Chloroflexota bacterium]
MECPHCGATNKPDSRYCGECGRPLGRQRAITCPLCDTVNAPGILVCTKCGADLIPPGVSPAEISAEPGDTVRGEREPGGPEDSKESDGRRPPEEATPSEGEPDQEETRKEAAPPWVQKLQGVGVEGSGEEGEEEADLPRGQLPGWLEVSPEYEELLDRAAATGDESGAEPGEVPSWLEQLRPGDAEPVEDAKEGADLGESVGVLKGLRGTLGIEPVLAIPRRASPRVPGLPSAAVDERGELFAAVVRERARPGIELAGRRRAERLVASGVRWINHLILLAAVAVPLLLGSTWSAASLSPTDAATAMYQTVETLPPGAVVLISHDYD